jgi:hypothetical protein
MVKSTRLVINVFSDIARSVMLEDKKDREALLDKYKGKLLLLVPRKDRADLKVVRETVCAYFPNAEHPDRFEQVGLKRLSDMEKKLVYLDIKNAYVDAGCSIDDFEVKFHDE